jgi:hypothetical protein
MTKGFNEWLDEQISAPGRESPAGFHMVSYYNENPYGWYLRYIKGYRPIHTKPPLIMGGALHSAAEAAYLYHDREKTLKTYDQILRSRRKEYAEEEAFHKDLADGSAMLPVWYDTWVDRDFAEYDILEVEKQHEVPLADGSLFLTVRPDQVFRRKSDGKIYVKDIKSSRWSITKAHEYLSGMDQSTCYLWAAKKLWPKNIIAGLMSDIMYKNRSVVKAERPGVVFRTDANLAEFELEIIGLVTEMNQKVEALAHDYPVPMLFPRNGKDESFFGSEWPGIYRATLPPDGEAPFGYKIDDWTVDQAKKWLQKGEEK